MARVLGVSKAGFYTWMRRPPSAHAVGDAALMKRVRTVHATSRHIYGAPRVHAQLRALGEKHGRNAIAESFFSTLEAELLARRRFAFQAEAKMACLHRRMVQSRKTALGAGIQVPNDVQN